MVPHGRDLARATGQEYRADHGTANLALDVVDAYAEMYRQYQGFTAPVAARPDATAREIAVARSGRDPY